MKIRNFDLDYLGREGRLAKTVKISYDKSHMVYRLGQVSIENSMDT